MIGIVTALLSGALMSVQGVFNTGVSKESGQWVTNTFVQFTGFLVCLAIWFFYEKGQHSFFDLLLVDRKYMLLGGVIGAFITITVMWSMSGLGPAKAVMLIVVSQIITAYLIEVIGLFGVERSLFQWKKLLGAALAIGGIILFQWES